MTTTGKFLVETSNDEAFEVGHTYSITATISQRIDVFGVTDVTPPSDESSDVTPSDETPSDETPSDVTPSDESSEPVTPATA